MRKTRPMSLSRERLLSALPRTQPYTLTGDHSLKGETVTIRALSAAHYTEWLATTDPAESRIVLLVGGLADPELTVADAEGLLALEAALVIELGNAVAAFAGILPRRDAEPPAPPEEAPAAAAATFPDAA